MSRTEVDAEPGSRPPPEDDHAFLGQPKGLLTLSGLEVWERFSFLGMQAVPVLYFAGTLAHGGMGMSVGTAASVSAAYGTLVYLVSVAGGWLADRIPGSYRAVLWGGVLIACGHYAMAVPTSIMTWAALGLISAGTGLPKPNVATMVGKLYRTDDERRAAGFALYYMAINIGAFAGPLITGRLGGHKGWHWGFSAAAVGMTLGLVQYVAGRRHLAGRRRTAEFALTVAAVAVVLGGLSFLLMVVPTSGHGSDDHPMSAWWIVGSYLLLGLGDILLETSGMSATTKLAPAAAPWLRRMMHPVH